MVIWQPQPKQKLALSCPAFEMFYGGAAGGGKSDFLLIDYLAGCNKYGEHWIGILFRRTVDELGALIKRAKDLYIPLGAKFAKTERTFYFPSGSTLQFRYLKREDDVEHYQGPAYTWVGFDELGNYPSSYCWTYMISRLRSVAGVPTYIRGSGNPGGVGHSWIKKRFIDGKEPNRLYERKDTGATSCFIPSLLDDNQKLMVNDPGYERRMKMLPKYLYRALRYGDWNVIAGSAFEEFDTNVHIVRPFTLLSSVWLKFASMDWGYSRPFSIGWWAANRDGRLVRYREFYGCDKEEDNKGIKMGASEVAQKAYDMSILEGVDIMVADPAVWSKSDDGPSIAEKFEAVGWKMKKANNDRINGKMQLHQLLRTKGHDGKPSLLIFENCREFIRTIPLLLPDKNHPEDIDTTLEDHIYDETRYAIMSEYANNTYRILQKKNGQWNFRNAKTGNDWDLYR